MPVVVCAKQADVPSERDDYRISVMSGCVGHVVPTNPRAGRSDGTAPGTRRWLTRYAGSSGYPKVNTYASGPGSRKVISSLRSWSVSVCSRSSSSARWCSERRRPVLGGPARHDDYDRDDRLWISFGFWWVYFYSSTVGCRDATA